MGLKKYLLKLEGAIVVEGRILRKGATVEMIESEARLLLSRGKAVLAEVESAVGIGEGEGEGEGGENTGEDTGDDNKKADEKPAAGKKAAGK